MPKREWTDSERALVVQMNAAGASHREIAKALRSSPRTIRRVFGDLLDPQEGGRNAFVPTEEQRDMVQAMAGFGLTRDEIAIVLKVSVATLEANFREELELGAPAANARVATALFQMATQDRIPSAAIFWLKARAGWKDHVSVSGRIGHEHSGKVDHQHEHDHTMREVARSLSPGAREGLRTALLEMGATSALSDDPPAEGDAVH